MKWQRWVRFGVQKCRTLSFEMTAYPRERWMMITAELIRFVVTAEVPDEIWCFVVQCRWSGLSNNDIFLMAVGGRYDNFKDFINLPNEGSKSKLLNKLLMHSCFSINWSITHSNGLIRERWRSVYYPSALWTGSGIDKLLPFLDSSVISIKSIFTVTR